MDEKKKKTKKFDMYNLAIIGCVILIIISAIILFVPNKGSIADKFQSIFTSTQKKEISEDKAKEKAVKKFKELGEDISKDNLQVIKIQRSGEEYYYITSKKNTMEVKVIGGKITRVNSVVVDNNKK